ncbi:MAG: T9SS type A sorting domain-containing protein [Bacteroidetes bacterium]|nr:T9SS type A sorting domain-containing protein [Bacteroidota bacterium]
MPVERLADGSETIVSSNDNYFEDELIIYPSPNEGNFYIAWENVIEKNCTINIVNSLGNTVYSNTIQTTIGGVSTHVNMPDLPAGIYFVVVYANDIKMTKKIIVD